MNNEFKSIQTWSSGLKFEKSERERADDLYKYYYDDLYKIKRWPYENTGKVLQKNDIDVTLIPKEFNDANQIVYISEKFRSVDFNDIYLEIFNNMNPNEYDTSKLGWASNHHNLAHILCYYTPTNVYAIYMPGLISMVNEFMADEKMQNIIKDNLIGNKNDIMIFKTSWKGNQIELVKNYTDKSKSKNISIGLCIPWDTLAKMNITGVKITELGTKQRPVYRINPLNK